MRREKLTILGNRQVSGNVFEMRLGGCTEPQHPGQFVELSLEGYFLRRPISVCDWTPEALTLLYKVVGKGTAAMSRMVSGDTIDALTGLGNGFDLTLECRRPLLVGGGIGVAPLHMLARKLVESGREVSVILGFNRADEVICVDDFRKMGAEVVVTTVDGSVGVKGFVTDALDKLQYDRFYACGPMPMLKALDSRIGVDGQVSLEERMGCGVGVCMGCTCRTASGPKRVCKEGPVFDRKEVIW